VRTDTLDTVVTDVPEIRHELPVETQIEFYRQMFQIRRVEETFLDLFSLGKLHGTVHTALGQEACAVGIMNALDRERDVIFSTHRAHGHFLAYCDDVDGLVGEVLGRATGVCGGVGGTQNLHTHNMYTGGIQGGMVPVAAGAALAEKHKGTGVIVVVFVGDGTMGQGSVYEGLNISSLWSLPLLFVLEDNQYAQSTPKRLAHAGDIHSRPATFEVVRASVEVDAVETVYAAACAAVKHVREHSRPYFLALSTYRLGPHSKGDDDRDPAEVAAFRARDPLPRLGQQLPESVRESVERQVTQRVAQATAAALAAQPQEIHEFLRRLRPQEAPVAWEG
jgi:acetoin:2,6-dichlorophenolindophenol oxidoreductase subunit alpha